jgi:hypothetical protein
MVVCTSIIGSFLSLFELYLGIAHRRGKNGRLSPYGGMFTGTTSSGWRSA